jgi:type IV pilus assembly protein PilO
MNLSNLDLDINKIGLWPAAIKIGIVLLLCGVITGLVYYFDTQGQLSDLQIFEAKEQELKASFEAKQKKAVNLDEYRQQLDEIEKSFGDLLRQLPDKTQVPDLLVDVSQTGLASGLEFELFKPENETKKDFYAELPINIRVLGSYMEFGAFISGLAALPRIVTIHNIKIFSRKDQPVGTKNKPLVMEALVKTYRYLEDGGVTANPDKKSRKQ